MWGFGRIFRRVDRVRTMIGGSSSTKIFRVKVRIAIRESVRG